MNEDKEQIKTLCRRVEDTAGFPMVKSKDFERLVILVFERTGTLLSPTTLKRLWGYLKEPTATRRSTLDLLAQYCGWYNFDEFLRGNAPEVESGFVDVKVLNVREDLKPGNVVTLMWRPSRICEIRYEGDGRWMVQRSEGTRLAPGDTFRCDVIMSGEPLYLNDLVHGGGNRGVYICGRRTGVTFRLATHQD